MVIAHRISRAVALRHGLELHERFVVTLQTEQRVTKLEISRREITILPAQQVLKIVYRIEHLAAFGSVACALQVVETDLVQGESFRGTRILRRFYCRRLGRNCNRLRRRGRTIHHDAFLIFTTGQRLRCPGMMRIDQKSTTPLTRREIVLSTGSVKAAEIVADRKSPRLNSSH